MKKLFSGLLATVLSFGLMASVFADEMAPQMAPGMAVTTSAANDSTATMITAGSTTSAPITITMIEGKQMVRVGNFPGINVAKSGEKSTATYYVQLSDFTPHISATATGPVMCHTTDDGFAVASGKYCAKTGDVKTADAMDSVGSVHIKLAVSAGSDNKGK